MENMHTDFRVLWVKAETFNIAMLAVWGWLHSLQP